MFPAVDPNTPQTSNPSPASIPPPVPSARAAAGSVRSVYEEATQAARTGPNAIVSLFHPLRDVHDLSFDKCIVKSIYGIDFHKHSKGLVNCLDYSDLVIIQKLIVSLPCCVVDKLRNISEDTSNPAHDRAGRYLDKYIHKNAFKWQQWIEESALVKVTSDLAWLGVTAAGAGAVSAFLNEDEKKAGENIRAALTLAAVIMGLVARISNPVKSYIDARATSNANKLNILCVLIEQRKSAIDMLDSICNDCREKGILDHSYSDISDVDPKKIDKIRDLFKNYQKSKSYRLHSESDGGKKYIGILRQCDGNDKRIDEEDGRLLKDVKDLGTEAALRADPNSILSVPRSRVSTGASVVPRSRANTGVLDMAQRGVRSAQERLNLRSKAIINEDIQEDVEEVSYV